MSRRWNKLWIGLVIGTLLPAIAFFLVYYIGYGANNTFVDFIRQTFNIMMLTKILSLCVLPNLAVFYFFLNREFWYATRGIILATMLCTVGIFIINFMF